jgi:hypothetical protein
MKYFLKQRNWFDRINWHDNVRKCNHYKNIPVWTERQKRTKAIQMVGRVILNRNLGVGTLFFFFVAQRPKSGPRPPRFEVSRSYTIRHTHTQLVGLFWTSDQLVVEAATYTTHNKHKRRISMPSAGFEPAIPVIERPQTYGLNRTATGIGIGTV